MLFHSVEGNRPTVKGTCIDQNKQVINLSGSTVRLYWRNDGSAESSAVMTIVSAAAGTISYQFGAGEENEPGKMRMDVEITDAGGVPMRNREEYKVDVRPK